MHIKKIKNKYKTKLLFLSFGLTSISLLLSLSSCAGVSQWLLPITTGNNLQNPFSAVANDPIGINGKDINDEIYTSYLSTNYITHIVRPSNSVNSYSYINPQNINDNNSSYGYGFYNSNDKKLTSTNEKSVLKSFQNIENSFVANSVSTVSATLSSLMNTMIHFFSQTGFVNNVFQDEWINKLINTTNTIPIYGWHGSKDGTNDQEVIDNKLFYEFLFDINNLLSSGRSGFRFDPSSQEFVFRKSLFNAPGPLMDQSWVGGADLTSLNSSISGFNVYSNELFNPSTMDESLINPYITTYASYKDTDAKDVDGNAYHALNTILYPVPVIVGLSNASMQFSYYNPLKNHGFLPNDYLTIDKQKLTQKICKTNAWNSIDKLIGGKDKRNLDGIKSKWAINPNLSLVSSSSSVSLPSNTEIGLKNIVNNITSFHQSDFLTYAYYGIITYKASDDDTTHPSTYYERMMDKDGNVHIPIFYGLGTNIYPIGLLYKDNTFSQFDESLLKEKTEGYYLKPDGSDRDGADTHKINFLDEKELNKKFAKWMKFLITMINKNQQPSDDDEYYYSIFKEIMGNTSSSNWLIPIE